MGRGSKKSEKLTDIISGSSPGPSLPRHYHHDILWLSSGLMRGGGGEGGHYHTKKLQAQARTDGPRTQERIHHVARHGATSQQHDRYYSNPKIKIQRRWSLRGIFWASEPSRSKVVACKFCQPASFFSVAARPTLSLSAGSGSGERTKTVSS